MRATTLTVGPLVAASANNIALSQTPSSAFTLNGSLVTGGVAILDTPRRVLFTFAGADVGKLITVVGTSDGVAVQSEVVTAVSSGTVYTNLDFKTVTSISTATALAAAVTVGTNGVASSRWMHMDEWIGESAAIQCTVTGTVNYSVQGTMQDPNSPTNPVAAYLVTWQDNDDTTLVAATSTQSGVSSVLPIYLRILLNSGSGSVSTVVSQASTGGGGGGSGGGGGGGTATNATASAAALPVVAGTGKPLNIDLFSQTRVLVGDTAGTPIDWSAAVPVTQSGAWSVGATNFPATVDTNSGNKSANTLRFVLATDQPNLTSALNVAFGATALTDGSTTITAGGTAQNVFAAAAVVNGYEIVNPDPTEDLWISDTTTAAANGTGSIRVAANGGAYSSPTGMKPSAAVSIIGATTGHKFTARRW